MPDADLTQQVIEVSIRLINESRTGDIEGEDVAREIDRSTNDLYWAFQEAKRGGVLEVRFPGGMELPHSVRLPRA